METRFFFILLLGLGIGLNFPTSTLSLFGILGFVPFVDIVGERQIRVEHVHPSMRQSFSESELIHEGREAVTLQMNCEYFE